jgi:multidrug resistance efflux pump
MTTLLCLIYASVCIVLFRFCRVPVTKWTVTTAVVGGAFLIGGILVAMNYNHPFSRDGRSYFYATPISPAVNGQVVEVPVEANVPLKKGDVLFRLDPRPFEFAVKRRKAALAAAEQAVIEQKAALAAATAAVRGATANRDRAKEDYERHAAANASKNNQAFSLEQVDDLRQLYLALEAALAAAEAQAEQSRLAANSLIDGVDTSVAQLEAELARAEFELEQSVYRAPTDGYATQVFLSPGMMAVSLPLRPVMTFVHTDRKVFAASFAQVALQRVKEGDAAEVSFAGVPGRVFAGRVQKVLQFMAEGQLEPSGVLLTPKSPFGSGRVIATIEITDDLSAYTLPGGTTAEVAIYTGHWSELAIIRKILLRMRAWENFLVFER